MTRGRQVRQQLVFDGTGDGQRGASLVTRNDDLDTPPSAAFDTHQDGAMDAPTLAPRPPRGKDRSRCAIRRHPNVEARSDGSRRLGIRAHRRLASAHRSVRRRCAPCTPTKPYARARLWPRGRLDLHHHTADVSHARRSEVVAPLTIGRALCRPRGSVARSRPSSRRENALGAKSPTAQRWSGFSRRAVRSVAIQHLQR
jgi:hypothetical protein